MNRLTTVLRLARLMSTWLLAIPAHAASPTPPLQIGIAVRDITPDGPIWLAGYASRNRASEKVDCPLVAQAVAIQSNPGEPVVLVSVDNCEVSREFTAP